ncbi:MAG: hypothetical protein F4X83_08145 [Chloroflexi bacterium]|nr:hypothetical protein [Chloroflexota bacterium]
MSSICTAINRERKTMFRAGVGRTTLTPPLGTPLIGYGRRERGADAIRDDIYATSLVLSDGAITVALVTCDLCTLPIQQVRYVQQRIEERTGIPPEHVLINTSHAHSGPLTTFNEETPAGLRRIVLDLLDGIAESVVQAAAKLVPCQIVAGKGSVHASINRRQRNGYSDAVTPDSPEGTVDPNLHVVRIDGLDGTPVAVITAYACHPVALRPPSHAYSADFVCALRECVEPRIGAPLLFAQGAAGNLVPIGPDMKMEERLELTGRMLGEEALRVHAALGQNNRQAQGMLNEEEKQSQAATRKESRVREESLGTTLRTEESVSETAGAAPTPQTPLLAASSETLLLDLWTDQPPIVDAGHSHRTFPYLTPPLVDGKAECAVQALRIGDVALVGVAGEALVEIGLAVKNRSPFPHTIFLGYTNGCLGYIPTAAAYPAGGYEVHRAHAVYHLPATVAPNSADRIVRTSLGLLGKL